MSSPSTRVQHRLPVASRPTRSLPVPDSLARHRRASSRRWWRYLLLYRPTTWQARCRQTPYVLAGPSPGGRFIEVETRVSLKSQPGSAPSLLNACAVWPDLRTHLDPGAGVILGYGDLETLGSTPSLDSRWRRADLPRGGCLLRTKPHAPNNTVVLGCRHGAARLCGPSPSQPRASYCLPSARTLCTDLVTRWELAPARGGRRALGGPDDDLLDVEGDGRTACPPRAGRPSCGGAGCAVILCRTRPLHLLSPLRLGPPASSAWHRQPVR